MIKRILAILFAVAMLLTITVLPAGAAVVSSQEGDYGYMLDDAAEKLTPAERDKLLGELSDLSATCKCNVLFAFVNDLSNAKFSFNGTASDYIQRYYETVYGVNKDGLLVLVTLSDENGKRYVGVFGTGKCEKRLTDDESLDIRNDAIENHNPDSNGYYDFFSSIASGLKKAVPPHVPFTKLLLAFGIGIVISAIIMLILKSQLKTVSMQHGAANYTRTGSMNVTASRDTYLYSTVTKSARPKESSSSHSSSGGGSYSGGGSNF